MWPREEECFPLGQQRGGIEGEKGDAQQRGEAVYVFPLSVLKTIQRMSKTAPTPLIPIQTPPRVNLTLINPDVDSGWPHEVCVRLFGGEFGRCEHILRGGGV